MSIRSPLSHPARLRAALALAVALLLTLLAATASAATPATMRLLGQSPAFGHQVTVKAPGPDFTTDPARALVRITPDKGAAWDTTGWCVDRWGEIEAGVDYDVTLNRAADDPELGSVGYLAAAWLIARADDLIAAADDPALEAGAIQIAVWRMTGQADDVYGVTDDAALNARADQLREMARGHRPATELALAAPAAPVAAGAAVTVTVTGTPGTDVDLQASGPVTLSATRVTLDATGQATVRATTTGAGAATVTARALGGELVRATHLKAQAYGWSHEPQDIAVIVPGELSAAATITAQAAPTPPAVVPPTQVAVTPRAVLRVVKSAPARAVAGRTVRYRLTVKNVSRVAARDVVLTDRLPAGTFLRVVSRTGTLAKGTVVWRLGTIRPGGSVTVTLNLRTFTTSPRTLRNLAVAKASNAALVRARTRTVLRAPAVAPVRTVPVTG